MRKNKIREIFWGIALVAAAIFLVMNQLHLFSFHLKVSMIIWTIVFGAALIESLADRSLFGTTFSIAFLLIVYAEPLHITKIVPWTVLIAALLIYIGLTLIFRKSWFLGGNYFKHKFSPRDYYDDWSDFDKSYKTTDNNTINDSKDYTTDSSSINDSKNYTAGEDIVINQKLSSVSRYVHSQNLRSVMINSSLGEVEVYLDQAKAAGDVVTVDINGTMGEIEIYVPLSWKVNSENLDLVLGELEISGESSGDGPTLVLTGHCSMSEVEINYV
ncbi:hypothetical protein GYV61_02580 [Lactobacillus melliventris]|uniref:LiaF transmembrane domain-containing protein n=1 Tax=Lactobacillus melliventris TaxID=1218507 RepID=UPI0015805559|nr:LiaF domain-containing protein [Lactobacillus melliventris]NUE97633.1 hypothetical protein [Lactobacillus melliventris]